MKQWMRKFMAGLLLVCLVLEPVLPVEAADEDVQLVDYTVFSEKFDTYVQETNALKAAEMRKNGWDVSNTQASYVSEEKYVIPTNVSDLGLAAAVAENAPFWSDYSVQADVTIANRADITKAVWVSVAGRISQRTYTGYEFGFYLTTDGKTSIRLLRRAESASAELIATETLAEEEYDFKENTSYTLKMSFSGDSIECYVGNESVLSATDDSYGTGCVAIRKRGGTGANISYDNVEVQSQEEAYTIHAECNTGGTITPIGDTCLLAGKSQTYTITPNYGYVIEDVVVDDVSKGVMSEYTFKNIEENHTLSVVFSRRSSDLNGNGICDDSDIDTMRSRLLSVTVYEKAIDANKDENSNVADLVRALRQKTLWGNTFENMAEWIVSNNDVIQFSESGAKFTNSASAISVGDFGRNYSVSANVTIDGSTDGKSAYVSLVLRRTGNTYYDYRFYYYGGELEARLYRYDSSGETTELVDYSNTYIQNIIGYRAFALGETVQLRVACRDNNIYCFIDDCFVGSYHDADDVAPQSGKAGFKVYNAVGSISDFEVQSDAALSIEDVSADDMKGESIQLYEGGTIYQEMEALHGICIDGTVLTTDMQHAQISEYDNKTVGRQQLQISLFENEIPVTLTVNERRSEIIEISQALENITTDNIDLETQKLLRRFDSLSEYEKKFCSNTAVSNHHAAVEAISARVSNADDEILILDNFENNQIRWDSGVEFQRGKAFSENGRYCIEQTAYGLSANCWRTADDFYGEIHSVSADMMTTSVYSALGLTMNVENSGYYYARVLFSVSDDGQNAVPTLKLFRKTSSVETLATVFPSTYGLYLSPETWFHMSITCDGGMLCVYINGTKLIEYDDSDAVEQFYYGSAGVYSYAGDSKFDNFVVCGKRISDTSSLMTPIATTYENNFEKEASGAIVDDWTHGSTDYGWKVTTSDSDYNLKAGSSNYLSGVEGAIDWTDYAVSCDVSLDEGGASAASFAEIFARTTSGASSGYEFGLCESTDGTTYLRLYKRGVSGGKINGSTYTWDMNIFKGRNYNLMMILAGNRILCYCDGQLVFDVVDSNAPYMAGYAGIRSAGSGGLSSSYDNYVVYKLAENDNLSFAGQEREILFSDDFTVGKTMTECGWHSDKNGTRASEGENNHCYSVVANEYTSAVLHVYEKNPTVLLDFMYSELTDAKFGFEIRKAGETAYVRIGYDKETGKWYLKESTCEAECAVNNYEAVGSITENEWHTAEIIAQGSSLAFTVDGQTVFDLTGISQTDFGKISIFAEGTVFSVDNVSCQLPSGDTVQSGVLEYYLEDGDDYAGCFEIESLDAGHMIGVGYNVIALSEDYGRTFEVVTDEDYGALDAGGAYSSMIELHDGSYLFVKQNDFKIIWSDGDMKTWEFIGTVISESEQRDSNGRRVPIIHVNSLTEIQLDENTWRIFLPVGVTVYDSDVSTDAASHYTVVYYSDDGGKTWSCSENDSRDVTLWKTVENSSFDWAEAKIIKCSDGTLRMYCSRNEYGCMLYSVSKNGGETWSGMYSVPELQCAKSSFSIIEDTSNSGAYYMVWVNDNPCYLGSPFARSRLSLAYSEDGKNWKFLCDVERTAPYVWSDDLSVTSPVFQIIDPSIEVTDEYVYVSYGCSDKTLEYDNGYHNAQQIKIVRIEKEKLSVKEWNAYTLSDATFTRNVSLSKEPVTEFSVGDSFTYAGGEIVLTALDGTQTRVDTKRFYLFAEPDMTTAGTKEVILFNRNGFSVTYTITVN